GEVRPELHENLGRDALTLADEAQQDMLRADVAVAQLQRFAQAQLEDLLRTGSERDVARRGLLALPDDLRDLFADLLEGDPHPFERLRRDALAFVDEAEQDVLGADVVVLEELRLFLREHDDAPGSVGEPFEHDGPPRLMIPSTVTTRRARLLQCSR